ncbi:hypothetical protein [Marmoricola sp. URHB0036]|uniref:hypothetical protein n=1 Tax=Marmoricola sp. URHB0036 TaxID=1298863 RepID=UPI0018CA7705|nr:hypothetical protein [Marmoricola sp. URHB0036]
MTIDDGRGTHRRVAVGHSRESAAAAFGRQDADLFVTSYADLEEEVDPDQLVELGLVLDGDFTAALEAACARLVAGGAALRIAVRPGAHAGLDDLLDRSGVTITDAERVDESVLLSLAPSTADHTGQVGAVLAALDAGADAGTDAAPERPVQRSVHHVGKSRPTPKLLSTLARADRWRASRRRRLVLGVTALVVVLALLLPGLLPDSPQVLVSIALPLLIVLVAVGTAVTAYTVLLLARQVHVQTGRLERMLLRNREVVHERSTALAKRLDAVEEAQSRLPFLEQYVEAVAEGSAASSTRLRDLLDRLDAEDATARD